MVEALGNKVCLKDIFSRKDAKLLNEIIPGKKSVELMSLKGQ